jgi:hypothetical protein
MRGLIYMTMEQLKQEIIKDDGYILSDGTLNLKHLFPKAYDLIMGYDLVNESNIEHDKAIQLCSDILTWFKSTDEEEEINPESSLFMQQYWGYIELKDEHEHGGNYSPWELWDEICNYFCEISPDDFYFGSNEGDGACIGWFKYEYEELEDEETEE